MRITYKMMTSKYSTNLNNQSTELDKLNTQVSSGRKFSRTSEDTSSAIKAYQIRKNMAKVEGYQNNIRHADDFLTNSESTLGQIEETLTEAKDKILQGMNGSQSVDERKIIATELRAMQDQLLQTLNTQVSDTYIFGGTNTEKPFTINADTKKLEYNGNTLDKLDGKDDAVSPVDDPTEKALMESLKNDSLYVDIGLGLTVTGGVVDKSSVFSYSIPGINFVGTGTTEIETNKLNVDGTPKTETVSNNVYDLLGRLADEFDSDNYSFDTVDKLYGNFEKATQQAYHTTTQIGSKSSYLEFMTDRYETQNFNMEKRQTEIEGVDAAYTYIAFQTQKVAYQAALQMGANIVQQSVFDYMT